MAWLRCLILSPVCAAGSRTPVSGSRANCGTRTGSCSAGWVAFRCERRCDRRDVPHPAYVHTRGSLLSAAPPRRARAATFPPRPDLLWAPGAPPSRHQPPRGWPWLCSGRISHATNIRSGASARSHRKSGVDGDIEMASGFLTRAPRPLLHRRGSASRDRATDLRIDDHPGMTGVMGGSRRTVHRPGASRCRFRSPPSGSERDPRSDQRGGG
jgi:hypothetical protein